ncbi:MAG: tRNA-dihydrouridine synthase [Candidatus Omnitrophota bacterium]
MGNRFAEIQNGVVLAELGGYGDGPYCAGHGAGAALVMMGTYIVEEGQAIPYPAHFVFKPGRTNYSSYLKEQVIAARKSGARVGVSVISTQISYAIDFLLTAQEAGADYASLCAHSEMEMFVKDGLGSALCRRENSNHLKRWAENLVKSLNIPVIFKIGLEELSETIAAVDIIAKSGAPIVHVNVENTEAGSPGLQMLKKLVGRCLFLIGGGGVKEIEGAQRVLETGANAVAIGTAAMNDPDLCGHLQNLLKKS